MLQPSKLLEPNLGQNFYYSADRNLAIFISQDGRMPPVVNVVDQFIAKFKTKFPDSPVPIHFVSSATSSWKRVHEVSATLSFRLK